MQEEDEEEEEESHLKPHLKEVESVAENNGV